MENIMFETIASLNRMAKNGQLGWVERVEYVGRMEPEYPRAERIIQKAFPIVTLPKWIYWWDVIWAWVKRNHLILVRWIGVGIGLLAYLKK